MGTAGFIPSTVVTFKDPKKYYKASSETGTDSLGTLFP